MLTKFPLTAVTSGTPVSLETSYNKNNLSVSVIQTEIMWLAQ